jgi:hypothetical protein
MPTKRNVIAAMALVCSTSAMADELYLIVTVIFSEMSGGLNG